MSETKSESEILSFIKGVAKLYADEKMAKDSKDEQAIKKAHQNILDYTDKYGDKTATYKEVEEAFAYSVSTNLDIEQHLMTALIKATESKLAVFLRLLLNSHSISNSDFESIEKQFSAINRDYNLEKDTTEDGK